MQLLDLIFDTLSIFHYDCKTFIEGTQSCCSHVKNFSVDQFSSCSLYSMYHLIQSNVNLLIVETYPIIIGNMF